MIGAASVALTVATWGQYLWRIPPERIPRRPWGSLAATGVAVILGLGSGSWWGWAAAVVAGYFWYLTLTSGYSPHRGPGAGDLFVDFGAQTADGLSIRSSDWFGRRVLFKFYRGPW